jgi:hypothetical protein
LARAVTIDLTSPTVVLTLPEGLEFGCGGENVGAEQDHPTSASLTFIVASAGLSSSAAFTRLLDMYTGSRVSLDLSNNSITSIAAGLNARVDFPVTLNLSSNLITSLPNGVFAFGSGSVVDLSFNRIVFIGNQTFADPFHLQALNLSQNEITEVAVNTFAYNFDLTTLSLAHNHLTIIRVGLVETLPALSSFSIESNNISAVPQDSNHISAATFAATNELQCAEYGPTPTNCTCRTQGQIARVECNYVYCSPNCSADQHRVVTCVDENSGTGTPIGGVPVVSCLKKCAGAQYYNRATSACTPLLDCRVAFPGPFDEIYEPAYQYRAATVTSDRLCSLCGSCPAGYVVTTCTATADTRCSKVSHLSVGDIMSVVLCLVILMATLIAALRYASTQHIKGKAAVFELEETANLLGEVEQENSRLLGAWRIRETDLTVGEHLAAGSKGEVWSGTWGSTFVAIKRLSFPLEDGVASDEFHREVC